MRLLRAWLVRSALLTCLGAPLVAVPGPSASFYPSRLEDPEAVTFSPGAFPIKADGKTDVSDALQAAIHQVKTRFGFGIVFVPEDRYLITKTITIHHAHLRRQGRRHPVHHGEDGALSREDPSQKEKAPFGAFSFW